MAKKDGLKGVQDLNTCRVRFSLEWKSASKAIPGLLRLEALSTRLQRPMLFVYSQLVLEGAI